MQEVNIIGQSKCYSSRWGARVNWWALHTEEAGRGASRDPYRLHNWMKNNELSYHYIGGNGIVLDIIDTDYSAWAAGDANPRTINACFAGSRADMSRKEWLDNFAEEIDYFAKLFVEDAKKYDPLDPVVLGRDYKAIRAGRTGGIDHSGITYGLGIGTHTDCGPNFPMDVWEAAVVKYAFGVPAVPPPPAPNMIDLEAARAAAWIGDRITEGEIVASDGIGRIAHFQNGSIYWTPGTGAHAIPTAILETYGARGWESGPLGYPIGDHTVLAGPDGQPWGDVQGFERGAIYRRYGQPGQTIWGRIRERWNRSGFENGPLGWPTSDEELRPDGSCVQQFEHGQIAWSPDGTTALQPVDGPDLILPDLH